MIKITLYPHELIGNQLKIMDSTSKNLVGLEGKIIDETRDLLVVKTTQESELKIQKKAIIWLKLLAKGQETQIAGKDIYARPWNRIKG